MGSRMSLIFLLKFLRVLRAGPAVSTVGILLLLGPAESLAQCTIPGGQSGRYAVTLNDVTFANRIMWTAQSIVAPERLSGLVPLHVYRMDELDLANRLSELQQGVQPEPEWHVGVAEVQEDQEGQNRDVWLARPLSRAEIGDVLARGDVPVGEQTENAAQPVLIPDCYIVSSIPFAGLSEVESLWIPESDWQLGLPHQDAMNPPNLNAVTPP